MSQVSFKERVKNIAIQESKNYKAYYVDYCYLVCSSAFAKQHYYIIEAKEDNYEHLLGVNSLIPPQDFFDKCYNGTLQESEFNFQKRGKSEKSIIGSVRRKIKVLPNMMNLFYGNIKAQETFIKNQVCCSFATSDNICTLGFISTPKSRPMTLLKGNELDFTKMKDVDLILRKQKEKHKFDEIIIGDLKVLWNYYEKIKEHIVESLFQEKIEIIQSQEQGESA
ncbi:PBECR4 domain-containing protein [Alkaliphilus serpentinus]|uniref:Phage-Barnase-EndoU-ColicinE5/D-RelE like nuclease 4 domain-containing protein n=1 Tax=Alkaliphilus serpentinus TaxID=1482731 RepID=A0A833HPA5_9FIRM|nr:PBECR4 domain-containing protein [Alkaliphilus serpentinus]KAB3529514.1 hypothetical protein F8153_09085 [Alkaliphilus serpentinus]